jgi:hypothetical protein
MFLQLCQSTSTESRTTINFYIHPVSKQSSRQLTEILVSPRVWGE